MTTDELVDDVVMYLNMGGALPDILPEKEIRSHGFIKIIIGVL